MPLGNLTSQFFANVYLNELDKFVKHKLKAKCYIRYVDDFVILYHNKRILEDYQNEINEFLKKELKLELHPSKSRVIKLSKGVTFLGFRIFYHYKLINKSNLNFTKRRFNNYVNLFDKKEINYDEIYESIQGTFSYMRNANTYKLRKKLIEKIERKFQNDVSNIEINRYLRILNKIKVH